MSSTSISDASQLAPGLLAAGTDAGDSEPASAPDPLVGQLLDSRYRVIERLAEGGMGTVYRAEHVALHKEVAIKLVLDGGNTDHAMRFLREAMLTSSIDHPNVVSTLDYGTVAQGAAYLVMGLVEGPTLAHVMNFECPMPWMRVAEIGAQIADAVAAAQAQGIVHRDLKPENVVLQPSPDGTELVKVLDFGIAKYARDSMAPPQVRGAQHVTQVGVVVGTPGYMAPEQAVGMRADHRADLYSIGVMLWECVAGRRLWDCEDVQRLLTEQLSNRPPLLRVESGDPTIPEDFEALVAELLATRPENRPRSAVEARDRLLALVDAERRETHARDSQPQTTETQTTEPIAAPPPRGTDTVFIGDAVAGWGAGKAKARHEAEPPAGANERQPTTRVMQAVAVRKVVEQPTTQVGFRTTHGDAALAASESSRPFGEPVAETARVPSLAPVDLLADENLRPTTRVVAALHRSAGRVRGSFDSAWRCACARAVDRALAFSCASTRHAAGRAQRREPLGRNAGCPSAVTSCEHRRAGRASCGARACAGAACRNAHEFAEHTCVALASAGVDDARRPRRRRTRKQ